MALRNAFEELSNEDTATGILVALERIAAVLCNTPDAAGRMRVALEAGSATGATLGTVSTVTGVTTVTTLSNITSIGGINAAHDQVQAVNNLALMNLQRVEVS